MKIIFKISEKFVNSIYNLPLRTKNILVALLSILLALHIYFFPENYFIHLAKKIPNIDNPIIRLNDPIILVIHLPLTMVLWKLINNEFIKVGKILSDSLRKLFLYFITVMIYGFLFLGLIYLAVIPGILFMVYSTFALVILIVDTPSKRKIRESFKRSIALVKSNFRFVYILTTLSFLIAQIIGLLKYFDYSEQYVVISNIYTLISMLVSLIYYKFLVDMVKQKESITGVIH